MMYPAAITKTNQVTIPKAIREILGLTPDDTRVIYKANPDGSVTIMRDMSEEEARAYMDSFFMDKKSQELIKKHAGKTVSELREEWDKSPEGRAYYKEKYGIR